MAALFDSVGLSPESEELETDVEAPPPWRLSRHCPLGGQGQAPPPLEAQAAPRRVEAKRMPRPGDKKIEPRDAAKQAGNKKAAKDAQQKPRDAAKDAKKEGRQGCQEGCQEGQGKSLESSPKRLFRDHVLFQDARKAARKAKDEEVRLFKEPKTHMSNEEKRPESGCKKEMNQRLWKGPGKGKGGKGSGKSQTKGKGAKQDKGPRKGQSEKHLGGRGIERVQEPSSSSRGPPALEPFELPPALELFELDARSILVAEALEPSISSRVPADHDALRCCMCCSKRFVAACEQQCRALRCCKCCSCSCSCHQSVFIVQCCMCCSCC